MKNIVITASAIVLAVICGITCLFCLERVDVGNVGVIYTANGSRVLLDRARPRTEIFITEGKMINEQDAIKAAETLKEWCDGLACTRCPFTRNGIATGCIFRHHDLPHQWKIPNPHRWTDDDIQLAKILKKLGVYKISYSNTGGPWWNTDDTGGTVPIGAFADLKPGETVPIDEIIGDSE